MIDSCDSLTPYFEEEVQIEKERSADWKKEKKVKLKKKRCADWKRKESGWRTMRRMKEAVEAKLRNKTDEQSG